MKRNETCVQTALGIVMSLVTCLFSSCSDEPQGNGKLSERKNRHILLITLDTTRQDRLGVYGRQIKGSSPTPNIDRIAQEGRAYTRAFASTPLTLPSHATMLTGLEPPQHGVRENNDFFLPPKSQRDFSTVAEELHDDGFETAAFTSSRVIAADFGLGAGFDVYNDVKKTPGGGDSHYEERNAVATTSEALQWLDKMEGPRSFIWVHYFDPHHPWIKHVGRSALVAEASSDYDGEIAFVDGQIGRLIVAYKERGLWNDTLVLVVGDHGEGLGEHGEDSHGFLLHDATMRIPFVVKPPQGQSLYKKRELARTVDVAPTILAFGGGQENVGTIGKSLFESSPKDSVAYGETVYPFRQFNWAALWSLRVDDWLLIEGGGKTLLFNHKEDPLEQDNQSAKHPDKAKELSRELLRLRRVLNAQDRNDSRRDPGNMRATPYVGGPSADIAEEPTVGENMLLSHPQDQMSTLRQLNRLIRLLKRMGSGKDDNTRLQAFLDAQILTGLMRQNEIESPSVLFWLGRAQWRIGSSEFARSTGQEFRSQTLKQGLVDFDTYLKIRALDYRAWDMRLWILLNLFDTDGKKNHLIQMVKLVKEQVGRGLDDGLMHNLHGLSLQAQGRKKEAVAAFALAIKKSPGNATFAKNFELARQRVKAK